MTNFKFFRYSTFVVIAVDLLATSGDITMTWPSPILPKLHSNDSTVNPLPKPITQQQDALIASSINVGAMIGGLPFAYISDRFGRKLSLQAIGCLHLIAYLSMAFAGRVEVFYFGRLLGGVAVGGGYTLLPMYIAEVTEETLRGAYSVTLGIFWSFGNFLSYLIGPFVSIRLFNLVNASFPLAFLVGFSLLGTETPYYLVGIGDTEKAEEVLIKLRSSDRGSVQNELERIKISVEDEDKSIRFGNVLALRKSFVVSISLIVFQQLSGWNAITSYLQVIFDAAGADLPSDVSALIIGGCIFVFSLPAPYFTEKFDRKMLLIISTTVLGMCLSTFGIFFCILTRTDFGVGSVSWIPLVSLVLAVASFQTGLSCLPWTISSEIFPKNVKKLSASATSTSCWLISFLVTLFFNKMTDGIGVDGTFFAFAGFCFVSTLFTIFYVPETRGKTFAEIQLMLER
ncbi:facilitated trehalose transporter Tret1-like [Diorhabda sublineata]|uniref:facilitated trehalose transporter Tret1-like n=1 Tax=Diorhabda sublineata TaxID=1163346 RepID=UPI0024E06176|nr:facilitated trehalose transporter Tret1-like [Diorhabda sublineata]